jgi:hypothetical protein
MKGGLGVAIYVLNTKDLVDESESLTFQARLPVWSSSGRDMQQSRKRRVSFTTVLLLTTYMQLEKEIRFLANHADT